MDDVIIGQKCFLYDKETKKVLLLKRSNYKKGWAENTWDLPGGRFDEHESDLQDSLKREAKEEIKAKLKSLQIITSYMQDRVEGKGKFIFFLYICEDFEFDQGKPILSHEHTEYKWVAIEEAIKQEFPASIEHCKDEILPFFSNFYSI